MDLAAESAPAWAAIGAGLDSAGRGEGEERAPAALRSAGLLEAIGAEDRGDLDVRIEDSRRDPKSGLIGFRDVFAASEQLRGAVRGLIVAGRRPLVLGGDCTVLIGALAGARQALDARVGLAFVDGHLDFYDGRSSPTGECADTELAIVTGGGPRELAAIAGSTPIVEPSDVIACGYRPEPAPETVPSGEEFTLERDLLDPAIEAVEAVRIDDPGGLGRRIERRLAAHPGRFWLHLDADVLDPKLMPAVSYPEPDGLGWEEATALIAPLGASSALVGVSVADLNTDLDPDGRCAARLAELIAAALNQPA